ncbi:class I SAM-dependent methyltransferase [bacterium]|nr:class I SAM-dependent methyltransferase [candidate division CSSED10-310 bacterium]
MGLKSLFYRDARKYDQLLYALHGEAYDMRFKRIAAHLSPGDKVLDIGCGTCHLASFMPPETTYLGMDLNQRFLQQAAARGIATRCADLFDVTAYPREYTTAVMVDMMHHLVPRGREFLTQLGGLGYERLLICESVTSGAKPWERVLAAWVDRDGFSSFWQRVKHHLYEEYTVDSLKRLFEETLPYQACYEEFASESEFTRKNPRIVFVNLLAIMEVPVQT